MASWLTGSSVRTSSSEAGIEAGGRNFAAAASASCSKSYKYRFLTLFIYLYFLKGNMLYIVLYLAFFHFINLGSLSILVHGELLCPILKTSYSIVWRRPTLSNWCPVDGICYFCFTDFRFHLFLIPMAKFLEGMGVSLAPDFSFWVSYSWRRIRFSKHLLGIVTKPKMKAQRTNFWKEKMEIYAEPLWSWKSELIQAPCVCVRERGRDRQTDVAFGLYSTMLGIVW